MPPSSNPGCECYHRASRRRADFSGTIIGAAFAPPHSRGKHEHHNRLNATVNGILKRPEVAEKLLVLGAERARRKNSAAGLKGGGRD
jgi:hypothetical protein